MTATAPTVVGVDGSSTALDAVRWAAYDRETPSLPTHPGVVDVSAGERDTPDKLLRRSSGGIATCTGRRSCGGSAHRRESRATAVHRGDPGAPDPCPAGDVEVCPDGGRR